MNNFDDKTPRDPENLQNANENEKDNSENAVHSSADFEHSAQGVVFNEDGTYHGVVTNNEKNDSPKDGSDDSDFGRRNESGYSSQREHPYSPGERNNGTYPYGNNNGGSGYYGQGRNPYAGGYYNGPRPQGNYPYGNSGYNPYSNGGNPSYPNNNSVNYAYNDNDNGKKGKGTKIFAIIAGILCALLVIALVLILIDGKFGANKMTLTETTTVEGVSQNVDEFVTQASPETGDSVTSDGELLPKGIYSKVLPSSVGILVYGGGDDLASEGSGVLFQQSKDGKYTYIITCAHVISDDSGYIVVQTYDGKEYDASVVGYDSRTDIGVLRIEASGLTLAEIGDSSKIFVGDSVYAIGNPGGIEFANSFTNGMVSALDRPVNSSDTGYTMDCIQHTAAINPGNSGGALVNSFGQVIGINSMKIVDDEYEGMGFAVPSSVFQNIVNEIMANGYVTNRPKLGITYVPASQYSNYGMFVAIKGLPAGSIVIYEIASDSSLAETDVESGDMIIGVNGTDLTDPSYLAELIENSSVGDELTLSIIRIYDDYTYDEFDVKVTLVEDRGTFATQEEETEKNRLPENYDGYDSYEDFFRDYFGE